MATNPARSRKLSYRIGSAVSLVLAVLAGLVMVAPSAFAHHPIVSGTSSCLDDGSYKVNWTIANSESTAGRYMLIKAFSVTSSPANQTGTTTGLVANGSYTGLVTASTPTTGTIVAPGGNVGAITTNDPSRHRLGDAHASRATGTTATRRPAERPVRPRPRAP